MTMIDGQSYPTLHLRSPPIILATRTRWFGTRIHRFRHHKSKSPTKSQTHSTSFLSRSLSAVQKPCIPQMDRRIHLTTEMVIQSTLPWSHSGGVFRTRRQNPSGSRAQDTNVVFLLNHRNSPLSFQSPSPFQEVGPSVPSPSQVALQNTPPSPQMICGRGLTLPTVISMGLVLPLFVVVSRAGYQITSVPNQDGGPAERALREFF